MSARGEEPADTDRSRGKVRETIAGALLVALFALLFLRRPLAELGDGVLSGAAHSQSFPLLAVDEDVRPENPLLFRTWTTHEAWRAFAAERLAHGVLPTWNALNGGGAPFLANPQTAVFSPFTWPYCVLERSWAAFVATFAKLFLLGFGTFLFLRELRLHFVAAALGALVFQFGGSVATALLEPATASACLLPFGLFLVERVAQRAEGRSRTAEFTRPSIALALVAAGAFLGGAIDTFAVSAAVVGTWAVLRLAGVHAADPLARRGVWRAAAHLGFAALAALLVCAVQWLPWLELLGQARESRPAGTEGAWPPWPMFFFPKLFGDPAGTGFLGPDLPRPGWSTFAAAATGALPLVLALFGFSASRRSRTAWFFAACGSAGACVGFLATGFDFGPGTSATRALVLVPFAVAVLAALAVDHVAHGKRIASAPGALATFAAAAALLLFARHAARSLLERALTDPGLGVDRALAEVAGAAHVELVVATALLGVGLFALAAASGRGPVRQAALLALLPLAYVQGGALFEDYHPLARDRWIQPRTADVARREGTVGIRGSLVLGTTDVPPDVNAIYGLRALATSSPLRVKRYDQLHETLLHPRGEPAVTSHTSRRALDLLGVECVFDPDGWVDVETWLEGRQRTRANWRETTPILPGTGVAQYFSPPADGLEALRFPWVTRGVPNDVELNVTVDDLDTGQRLVGIVHPRWTLRPLGRNVLDCVVPFPSEAKVAGHALLLRVSAAEGGRPEAAYAIGCRAEVDPRAGGWRATQGERVLEAPLELDLHYALRSFARTDRVGPLDLFTRTDGLPRFHAVGSARVARDAAESWDTVFDPGFDPRREVVLEAAPRELERAGAADDEADARVEVLDEVDGHARVVVKRRSAGFLVTPIAWYPGWKARVNGAAATPLCANFAFTAVPVPAGESLVELDYAPKSQRNGIVLALLGLVALVVAFARTLPPERSPEGAS